MTLDAELLEILVCPECRGELTYDDGEKQLRCPKCRLAYRVEEDIPVLLIDEAESY